MQRPRQTTAVGWSALVAGKLLVVLLFCSCLHSTISRAADEPLMIARQGNFYVGGKYVESKGDMPMVGQAFVEFQIPYRQTQPYPIVMVHGGSQTGAVGLAPGGREAGRSTCAGHDLRGRSGRPRRSAHRGCVRRPGADARIDADSPPWRNTTCAKRSAAVRTTPSRATRIFDNYFASNVHQ